MSNKLKSIQEFESHLTSLFHELRDANDHFYFVDCLRQAISDYEREINHSPAFWGKTVDAHVSATMSHLCRVYDHDPAAVHLIFLLESVRDNPDLFCGQAMKQRLGQRPGCDDLVEQFGDPDKAKIEEDIKFCGDQDPPGLVRKLQEWRNNVVAHLNKRVSVDFDSFQKRWLLERGDIQKLISKGSDILNRCAGWSSTASLSFDLPSPYNEDYKFVFESMRTRLSKQDERDELLMKLMSKSSASNQETANS